MAADSRDFRVPVLHPDHVHVWRGTIGSGQMPDPDLTVLSQGEHDRLKSISNPDARALYAASHVALRHVLAAYHGRPSASLRFKSAEGGKPYLVGGHGLSFNLSHSGQMLLIAVTRSGEVGVDIERTRYSRRSEAVARRFFAPEEYAGLAQCPVSLKSQHFAQIWALKEAYIKATGRGLALPLRSFALRYAGEKAELIRTETGNLDDWTLAAWTPVSGYRAAVAVQRRGAQIHQFDLSEANILCSAGSLS
ncbi:4'-phosphopantetheinyl transferase family protein [Phaeobacter sp. C3_T13_0]|uniref:4'-phosphopantetheinyl transferase family protein n=1 Tax=Phaeobacter cretensis TaxID=3342641 RepID=UPI0039BCD7D1